MNKEALIPVVGVVTDVRTETPDVKTFRVVGLDGKKLFEHIPGQCAMLSIPGVGEAMFSIRPSTTCLPESGVDETFSISSSLWMPISSMIPERDSGRERSVASIWVVRSTEPSSPRLSVTLSRKGASNAL